MSSVLYEERDAVARITLQRPERLNALTAEMWEALLVAFRRAAREEVRAVLVTGAGRAFCSGSDLKDNFGPDRVPAVDALRRWRHPVLLAMRALPKPVVCAVDGVAAGIGCSLALAGDLVIASERARFDFSFIRLGLVPDGGASWALAQSVGRARALRLALLSEPLTAAEAERWGLIARCVGDDAFEADVEALVSGLAAGPTRGYALAKATIDAASASALAHQLEYEATQQAAATATADFAEGLEAFLAKRSPVFRGR
jgi:2-(1,2-epoxy-1,2-dihydrophenyl)acetyl-CoA isomerase